jgi:hypothetical protein
MDNGSAGQTVETTPRHMSDGEATDSTHSPDQAATATHTAAPDTAAQGDATHSDPARNATTHDETAHDEMAHGHVVPEPAAKGADPEPPPVAASTIVTAPRQPQAARLRGRWFSALCAFIAVVAAGATLTAPWLRPQIDTHARQWLGADNVISRVLKVDPATLPAAIARTVADEEVHSQFAAYDQRLQTISGALDSMHTELAQAVAALHAGTASFSAYDQRLQKMSDTLDALHTEVAQAIPTLSGSIDGLTQRADRMQSAGTALDARTRAATVLALAVGLRRNIDAGVPIDAECAALKAIGAFPDPVNHALQDLTQLSSSVPTMRDLADGFDMVQSKLAERGSSASAGRGWGRLEALLGVTAPSADDILLDRLRALAAAGRFSEAAKALETSDAAYLGADWITMVHARATAVIATQMIVTYALQATDTAFASGNMAGPRKSAP